MAAPDDPIPEMFRSMQRISEAMPSESTVAAFHENPRKAGLIFAFMIVFYRLAHSAIIPIQNVRFGNQGDFL